MNAQTELPDVDKAYQAYMAATDKLEKALKTHSGETANCRAEQTRCLAVLIAAETSAGFTRKVPARRPDPGKTDYATAAKAYLSGQRTLTGLDIPRLEAEHSVWKRALCAATHKMPGAFSAAFCQRKIKQIGEALHRAANSALLRDIKF